MNQEYKRQHKYQYQGKKELSLQIIHILSGYKGINMVNNFMLINLTS